MQYPFSTLWINGREVTLADVVQSSAPVHNDFEEHTFQFIRDWLGGREQFQLTTSGSTGTPKPILVTRTQMEQSARMTEQALSLKPGYTALVCLNTQYIAGKMMLVRCLVTGMRIVAVSPVANPLATLPPPIHIDFTAWVPFQLYAVLDSPQQPLLSKIGGILLGGAPLHTAAIERLQAVSCACYATYGMTETVSHIALQPVNGPHATDAFHALPGVTLNTDERDCLIIHAPHVPQPVITNDVVHLINATSFQWLGRWDNIINTGGVKVSPEKIETAIQKVWNDSPFRHLHFFVGAVPDTRLGQKVVLFVETDKKITDAGQKILKDLSPFLTPFEIPKEIISAQTFAYTATGKINRTETIETVTKRL